MASVNFLGISLGEPSCSIGINGSEWEIKDAVFDCEVLPSCSVTCSGPSKEKLNTATEQCGCTLEWYLHSKWMGTALAFLLYLLMNIARVFFFSGLTRLLWKRIYPDRFTVLVTCDSEGAVVTASRTSGASHEDLISAIQIRSSFPNHKVYDGENLEELSKELHAKLGRILRNFYITGASFLMGSLVFNGIWIYLVVVTSQSLTPRFWK